ncbi:MAG: ATP-binding protein [Opitutales bacterium]|nr:ATP-binding protein [Opitutales bacterium]
MKIGPIPILKQETILRSLEIGDFGVIILDSDSQVEWMSPVALELFGLEPSNESVHLSWADLIQIDGQSVWSEELEKNYLKDGYLKTEGFFDAPEKGRIAVELVMYQDEDSHERFVVLRDISKQKNHEIELEQEKHNTDQLNQALEREIAKANELAVMAERANIAKSVFLTSMSHEFRTPLNGVLGYAQVLEADDALTPENKKAVATIQKCGKHLLSLINDVLDLSKIEAGKIEVSHEPVNIKTLISEVADVFRVRAQTKGIDVECRFIEKGKPCEWIMGDSKLVRQVLINLVGNAVKFTEKGLVTVSVESGPSDNPSFDLDLKISVSDTGPGIEEEYLQQIFEEFYQTEAFSGHKGGTGLGLAISRKLSKSLGGELQVTSEVGKGSCFWFDLSVELASPTTVSESREAAVSCKLKNEQNGIFIQLYEETLDHGVLQRAFSDWGFSIKQLNPEDLEHALFENRSQPVVLGLSAEQWNPSTNKWVERCVEAYPDVAWRTLVLGNFGERFDELKESENTMMQSFPLDLGRIREQLMSSLDARFFEKEQSSVASDIPSIREETNEWSDAIPHKEILMQMLTNANIGDMRSMEISLTKWEDELGQTTQFGRTVLEYVSSFRIEALCEYLEKISEQS